jgi:hypothetical protein
MNTINVSQQNGEFLYRVMPRTLEKKIIIICYLTGTFINGALTAPISLIFYENCHQSLIKS